MRNVAVILANGTGNRAGFDTPKQLVRLAGRAVINWTVGTFLKNTSIDEVVVICDGAVEDTVRRAFNADTLQRVRFVTGGATRNESTKSALRDIRSRHLANECNVLIHDSVRPLVSHAIIKASIDALDTFDAVDVVVPAADTIVESLDGVTISRIADRASLRCGQTPQGFKLSVLEKAYAIAEAAGDASFTDDCGVVLRYLPSVKIGLVPGAPSNHKLTYKEDLFFLEKIVQHHYNESGDIFRSSENSYFQGKVAVVIGGFTGIGQAIAEQLESWGATVLRESRRTGFDLLDFASFEKRFSSIAQQHGRIDAVICSSAIMHKMPLSDSTADCIADQIAINLTAPILVAKAAFPYLKKTSGCLVNFASSSYTLGRAEYAAYSASKAGIVNAVQALADEWADSGVRVLAICPERTATTLRQKSFGVEEPSSLLGAGTVAADTIRAMASGQSGAVIEVRKRHAAIH